MPVHPEVQQLLDGMAEQGAPPFEEMTVPQAREATSAFEGLQGEPENVAKVENRAVPGPDGNIPVRIYTPSGDGPFPIVVFYHGGGWVIGNLETVDRPCRALANAAGALVISVDYRLAPEHRYPAAFDDAYAAAAWAADHAAELSGDATRLCVSGDSAGGNLAAAVALAARDRKGPAIAAQFLAYPVIDFDFTTTSYDDNKEGYLLTRGAMQWFWAHYLGAMDLGPDPYICPGRAPDLHGLPPAYVATCEFDPLRDEGEAYAKRLTEAGVPVVAKRFDGMVHGFLWTLGATPVGASIMTDLVDAINRTAG